MGADSTSETPRARSFWLTVAAISGVGLAARVAWTLTHGVVKNAFIADQTFYHRVANLLANGSGYVVQYAGGLAPTAKKPPLYPLLLAAESKLGSDTVTAHRLVGAALGALTIATLAWLAREVAGPRVGIIVAVLAAIDPQLWVLDSQILSEALYGPLLVTSLLLAYRLYERPTARRGVALGAVLALAILTRPEAIVVGGLLALLLLARWRAAALPAVAVGAAACLALMGPWVIRNAGAFDRPVYISTQSGANLAGANCPATYYGDDIGNWRFSCLRPNRPGEDESEWAAEGKQAGLRYARAHASRVPLVVLARIGRTWGFYKPRSSLGGDRPSSWLDPLTAWLLTAAGAAGIAVALRRRLPIAILLVPAVTVTITAVVQFGLLRYRHSADLAFLVFAGIALDALRPDVDEAVVLERRQEAVAT